MDTIRDKENTTQLYMHLYQKELISTETFLDYMQENGLFDAKMPGLICPLCGSGNIFSKTPNVLYCNDCPLTWTVDNSVPVTSYADPGGFAITGMTYSSDGDLEEKMEAPLSSVCPECKGSKVYVGLLKTEPCSKCKGTGTI